MAIDAVTAALAVESPSVVFDPPGDIAHLHPVLLRRALVGLDGYLSSGGQ
jgi:hypothetical protein